MSARLPEQLLPDAGELSDLFTSATGDPEKLDDRDRLLLQIWEESVRDTVLSRSKSPTAEPYRWRLEDERDSLTHHFKIGDLTGYMTVGMYHDGKPGEIFLRIAKQGTFVSGIMDAFVTSVSIGLQHGIPLSTFIQKFRHTGFEPAGMVHEAPHGMSKGVFIARSVLDYLFQFLEYRFPKGSLRRESDGDTTRDATEDAVDTQAQPVA